VRGMELFGGVGVLMSLALFVAVLSVCERKRLSLAGIENTGCGYGVAR
jgi:hypothetical protein